jgi:peptide-methionine (S)-S-oxide reductase
MFHLTAGKVAAALSMVAVMVLPVFASSHAARLLPDPKVDAPLSTAKGMRTAVFAGGCFWGVEAVFEHVKGVTEAVSGYAGGNARTAKYEVVSSGGTGHAESVRVTYDPSRITYGKLLKVFFSVAHNPTELNRQGPDTGTQYRSAIFYGDAEQKRIAESYIAQLSAAHTYPRPIVTQVTPLKAFYEAEAYHQNYLVRNPGQPYIIFNDLPKLANLKRQFPQLYAGK